VTASRFGVNDVRIESAADVDMGALAALQQEVFGDVLEENGIPLERLGADVFTWKLAPPLGSGRVAMVREGGEMLGTLSAYPLVLASGEERRRAWHLCDAATTESARGRGVFSSALRAMRERVPADQWAYAFPNHQSRPAFLKQDYATAVEVPLWFRPVMGRGRRGEGVREIEGFTEEHDALADRLASGRGWMALRSAAYLGWRYLAHPYFDYRCFELRRDELDGILVVNRMEARGRTSLWVMELLAVDRKGERELARTARWLGKETGCDVVLSMAGPRLPGAVRLPPCFLPKKHVLMVRNGGTGDPVDVGEWDVQTGDWDTF